MKAKFSGFIAFLFLAFLLLCSSSVSARLLLQINNHGEKELKAYEMMMIQADRKHDFSELMGAEECYEKDEECVKRRMMADAHLDYIYTQNHKP